MKPSNFMLVGQIVMTKMSGAWGYATPGRIAEALAAALPDKASSILDFGCGTGVSGRALLERGFTVVDGTDVSAEMIAQAEGQGIYRKLWQSEPGVLDVKPGDYVAIAAMGVISSGAAPPDTLAMVLSALGKGSFAGDVLQRPDAWRSEIH